MESFNFAATWEILIFSPACKTGKMSILRWIIPKKLGKFCQDNDSSEKEGEVERFDYYWRVPISHFAQKVCYVALSLFATAVFQVNLNIKVLLHFFDLARIWAQTWLFWKVLLILNLKYQYQ